MAVSAVEPVCVKSMPIGFEKSIADRLNLTN